MTLDQFFAISTLLRLRHGSSWRVAQRVLVDGTPLPVAARLENASYLAAYKTLGRIKRGMVLVDAAYAAGKSINRTPSSDAA